jgi:zinc and cadmium transporter
LSTPFLQSLVATFLVGAIALVGIVFVVTKVWSERLEIILVSLAAGVLLATAFLDLLPEAAAQAHPGKITFSAALIAMIGFFFLERFLHGFHEHEEGRVVASRYLILIGGAVHNFIDGIAIATSFLAGFDVGLITTLAVAAHEIPHELADYGILISGKFTPRQAVTLNFATGLTAMLGPVVVFSFAGFFEQHVAWFTTATAGMFIYIAASDLIPELHQAQRNVWWTSGVSFLGGVVLTALLTTLVPD